MVRNAGQQKGEEVRRHDARHGQPREPVDPAPDDPPPVPESLLVFANQNRYTGLPLVL